MLLSSWIPWRWIHLYWYDCNSHNDLTDGAKTLLSPDVDECSQGLVGICSPLAECKNTLGSYKCECLTGYHGDGKSCTGT